MKIRVQTPVNKPFDPTQYVMNEPLKHAVEVAIALNQPLLLTGEPGTGKTKLAFKVAYELAHYKAEAGEAQYDFLDQPLVFNTKTTSNARDLFYTYDALSHFQVANIKNENGQAARKTADFIELQALGLAIAQTNPAGIDPNKFRTTLNPQPKSSVVLIDEIDKAPRDFPNDILNEIENLQFAMKEQDDYRIQSDNSQRIVMIMTSNSEKNLPDAFLRRCVFYHIPFPNPEQLLEIVQAQLGGSTQYTSALLEELIAKFVLIRDRSKRKPPATAELVAWLRMLEVLQIQDEKEDKRQQLIKNNLSILVKTKEDFDAVKALMD